MYAWNHHLVMSSVGFKGLVSWRKYASLNGLVTSETFPRPKRNGGSGKNPNNCKVHMVIHGLYIYMCIYKCIYTYVYDITHIYCLDKVVFKQAGSFHLFFCASHFPTQAPSICFLEVISQSWCRSATEIWQRGITWNIGCIPGRCVRNTTKKTLKKSI